MHNGDPINDKMREPNKSNNGFLKKLLIHYIGRLFIGWNTRNKRLHPCSRTNIGLILPHQIMVSGFIWISATTQIVKHNETIGDSVMDYNGIESTISLIPLVEFREGQM